MRDFLTSYTLDESAKYQMPYLATSPEQVVEWARSVLNYEGIIPWSTDWQIIGTGISHKGKTRVKFRLTIYAKGKPFASKYDIIPLLERLTVILDNGLHKEALAFWLEEMDSSWFNGEWSTTIKIKSVSTMLPKYWKDRADA